jgi:universal stress protein A
MPFRTQKILVATDFSAYAQAAADGAGVLARAFDAEVTLLHVVPLTLYAEFAQLQSTVAGSVDLLAGVRQKVLKDAEGEQARLMADGQRCSFVTVDGPPAAEIARVAQEGHYDLVVIGTHGRTGLRRLAMGSVAENVVRLCSVSVLVVRADSPSP